MLDSKIFDFNKDGNVSAGEKTAGAFGIIAILAVFIWGRMKGKESFANGVKAGKARARKYGRNAYSYARRGYGYARKRMNYKKRG